MSLNERVHRYPRRTELLIELFSATAVSVALLLFGREALRLYWEIYGVDTSLFERFPWLHEIVLLITGHIPSCCGSPMGVVSDLLPSLILLLFALLAVIWVRYALPTIRTSPRGMLVEFVGGWLAVPWESITAIKVTEAQDRFVLLAETNRQYLTSWHRWYGLLYKFGFRRSILITSAIGDFDSLVKTLLSETGRVARVLEGRGAQLQEDATSSFFRMLLSPAAFFSQKAAVTAAPSARPNVAAPVGARDDLVAGVYPRRISLLLRWSAILLMAAIVVRAVALMLVGLALLLPVLRPLPPFIWLDYRTVGPLWWPFVSALLLLLIGLPIARFLGALLPQIAARQEGLAVSFSGRRQIIPWASLESVKVTELSETNQIVLIQSRAALPFTAHLSSLIYDGSLKPGVFVTSAFSAFEPLLQRIILEVMSGPTGQQRPMESPIFQSEARSDLLLTTLNPTQSLERLVEESRADPATKRVSTWSLLRAARSMAALAIMPALILLADLIIQQVEMPELRLFGVAFALFLLGMLEWPIIALASIALDEGTGGGEEGARVWSLYPVAQLPRLIALIGVFVLTLLAVPFLPALIWLAVLAWIFVLAAGLWGTLYDWRGGLLLVGGLIPVFFQIMVLIAYLVLRR